MMKRLHFLVTIVILIMLGCEETSEKEPIGYNEIIVGKVDYKDSKYTDYEPDIVLYAVVDFNDTVNNHQHNTEDYFYQIRTNQEIVLSLYSVCNTKGNLWDKELAINAGDWAICVTDTSDIYVRFFEEGDLLSIEDNFGRNETIIQEPANMTYDFKNDEILYEHNSNIKNKYMCFKTTTSDGLTSFQWIHFSISNLDSVIIHDAFSTHLE